MTSVSQASASLHVKLREATTAAHLAIESNARLSRLTSSALTENQYREILERYSGFFRPLENELRESTLAHEAIADLTARYKCAELSRDLLALGLSSREIERLPQCTSLPPLGTRAEILGVVYVTEGSALGGLMIAKHLATLPFYSPSRASFFHADPKGVSARWRSFLGSLERVPESEHADVVLSAKRTFEALDRWMAA